MTARRSVPALLFAGCKPEVAAGPDGRIIAVGARARAAAGRGAEVVRLRGAAWPGLIDSHIHLEGLAERALNLDLTGARSLEVALLRIHRWAARLPKDGWVVGSGWYNDLWPDPAFPSRNQLDEAAGGRPAYLGRKDGHSAWVSTAAMKLGGIDRSTEDPPGGVIARAGSAPSSACTLEAGCHCESPTTFRSPTSNMPSGWASGRVGATRGFASGA